MNFSYQTVNEKGNNKCNQYVMANFLIFHKICNIISKCVEQSHITRDGGNALKKHAILFVLIVCVVTVYGILSADHYFQLNNLEKQMELATGRIQSAYTARREADNVLLDYYTEYTQKNTDTVSYASAGGDPVSEDAAIDSESIRSTLSAYNIQDTRYQEIQLRVVNSEQNLNSAINRYNSLVEEYNNKIASPLFFPVSKLLGYEKATALQADYQ
ncbi:MAG: hypothetical protein DBY45_04155 [Clostridiales bacterium]|nr:MAG: hypothetical protein DBY45_04155 [Clostridiales bacterium]